MSCLFNSLSCFSNLDSTTIRNIICNYLETNGKIIEDLDTDLILAIDNIDGLLIGKASLEADEFIEIALSHQASAKQIR